MFQKKKKNRVCKIIDISFFGKVHTYFFKPLSTSHTKWSNTFKEFVDKLPTNCLSVFDHFVGLVGKYVYVQTLIFTKTIKRFTDTLKDFAKPYLDRGVFKTQSNLYDGAFLRKQLTLFNRKDFLKKAPRLASKYASNVVVFKNLPDIYDEVF